MIKYDSNRPWKWYHPLHEYISPQDKPINTNEIGKITSGFIFVTREGARSQDVMKYMRDALTLETSIKEESIKNPDASIDPRELFYLAQSYRDSGVHHLDRNAEELYIQRTTLGGFEEERYISFIEAGKCRQRRSKDDHKTLEYFIKAYELRPHRYEAPFFIVRWFRLHNMFKMGYTFGRPLLNMPYPKNDSLFIDDEIHNWKFFDEVAVCAFYSGDKNTCKMLCERILKLNNLGNNRSRIEQNLKFSTV